MSTASEKTVGSFRGLARWKELEEADQLAIGGAVLAELRDEKLVAKLGRATAIEALAIATRCKRVRAAIPAGFAENLILDSWKAGVEGAVHPAEGVVHPDEDVVYACAWLSSNLSLDSVGMDRAVERGLHELFVAALGREFERSRTHSMLMGALINLLLVARVKEHVRDAPHTVARVAELAARHTYDPALVRNALTYLANLVFWDNTKTHRKLVVQSGALELFPKLLTRYADSVAITEMLFTLIQNLSCQNQDTRRAVVDTVGFTCLIRTLSGPRPPSVVRAGLLALQNLVFSDEAAKLAFAAAGGLAFAARLLDASDPRVVAQALGLLMNLVTNCTANRDALVAEGFVPAVVKTLYHRAGYVDVQLLGMGLVCALVRNSDEVCDKVLGAGFVHSAKLAASIHRDERVATRVLQVLATAAFRCPHLHPHIVREAYWTILRLLHNVKAAGRAEAFRDMFNQTLSSSFSGSFRPFVIKRG